MSARNMAGDQCSAPADDSGFGGLNCQFPVSRLCATNTIDPACRTAPVLIQDHEHHIFCVACSKHHSDKGFPSASIFLNRLSKNTTRRNSNEGHRFATGAQEEQHELIPLQLTTTPFATESRVPIAPLLGARLQLNISMLNIRNGNVMLGPIPASETLHAPAQARSAEFYGFGVSLPLGRGSRVESLNNLLRSVTRIVRGN